MRCFRVWPSSMCLVFRKLGTNCCFETDTRKSRWSPIAGGYLARPADQAESTTRGQSRKTERSEADVQINNAIESIAKARGINMAQVAIAWVLHNKQVASPIVGISNARALDDAIKRSNLMLTDNEIKSIESPYKPKV